MADSKFQLSQTKLDPYRLSHQKISFAGSTTLSDHVVKFRKSLLVKYKAGHKQRQIKQLILTKTPSSGLLFPVGRDSCTPSKLRNLDMSPAGIRSGDLPRKRLPHGNFTGVTSTSPEVQCPITRVTRSSSKVDLISSGLTDALKMEAPANYFKRHLSVSKMHQIVNGTSNDCQIYR